jgi:AcrR family transcriptional regulator
MASTPARLRSRKTPTQARSVETRARILDAAARVFSSHGYSAGTTNRIAAAAGMSIGSLYQYFPNKDAILVELVRAHLAAGTEALEQSLRAAGPAPLTGRIGLLVDALIAVHLEDPDLHQVLFEEAPRPPELLAELRALEDTVTGRVAAELAADPAVTVADHTTAARIVVTTVESLVHRVIATRHRTVDVDAFRHELVAMVTCYLTGEGQGLA